MDTKYGEISRAMRNRGVEIYILGEVTEANDLPSLGFSAKVPTQECPAKMTKSENTTQLKIKEKGPFDCFSTLSLSLLWSQNFPLRFRKRYEEEDE